MSALSIALDKFITYKKLDSEFHGVFGAYIFFKSLDAPCEPIDIIKRCVRPSLKLDVFETAIRGLEILAKWTTSVKSSLGLGQSGHIPLYLYAVFSRPLFAVSKHFVMAGSQRLLFMKTRNIQARKIPKKQFGEKLSTRKPKYEIMGTCIT